MNTLRKKLIEGAFISQKGGAETKGKITCVRPGNNSCAHPSTCSRLNKCYYK